MVEWEQDESFSPETYFSIIIPFRNEAPNLERLIKSILQNQYPKSMYEIICVDDHSTDISASIIQGLHSSQVRLISNGPDQKGKKNAIQNGIDEAKYPVIITIDADCTTPKQWLRTIASFYEYQKYRMIVGMVALEGKKSNLHSFQILDTAGVMGLHAYGIKSRSFYLANGANLIFEKSLFLETNPYAGNENHASGDDVFFAMKVGNDHPSDVGFLKSKKATVSTKAENSWKNLYNQRKRWATKSKSISNANYSRMAGTFWFLSLTIVINLLIAPLTAGVSLFIALTQLLIKGSMDFLYLNNMARYFGKEKSLKRFIPAFLIQTVYVLVAGFLALTGGKFTWKERVER